MFLYREKHSKLCTVKQSLHEYIDKQLRDILNKNFRYIMFFISKNVNMGNSFKCVPHLPCGKSVPDNHCSTNQIFTVVSTLIKYGQNNKGQKKKKYKMLNM